MEKNTNFITDPASLEMACYTHGEIKRRPFPQYEAIAHAIDEIDGLDVFDLYDLTNGLESSFEEFKVARTGSEYEEDGYMVKDFTSVLVCRIAPLAAFSAGHKCGKEIGGTRGFSNIPTSHTLVSEFPWDPDHRVPQILHDHGFSILDPEIGRQRMPNGLEASTLFGDGDDYNGWTIFDGWFHCMD